MPTRNLQPEHKPAHQAWQQALGVFTALDTGPGDAEIDQAVASTFSSGPCFYYVQDFCSIDRPLYLSPAVKQILGLDPRTASIQELMDCVHADDLPFVARAEETAIKLFEKEIGFAQIKNYKISYCLRLKTRGGGHRLFNQQRIILAVDERKTATKSLVIHTDISHLTTNNNYRLSLLHLFGGENFVEVEVVEQGGNSINKSSIFTARENEIIPLLARGLTSAKISQQLNIAENTVKNHRKNILKKANCKTTGQLVSKCICEGLI